MSESRCRAIDPAVVAHKVCAVRDEYPSIREEMRRDPRLLQLLWFLQHMSTRPGRLREFADEILSQGACLGTETMLSHGMPANGVYPAEIAAKVWGEIDRETRSLSQRWLVNLMRTEDFSEVDRGETEFAEEGQRQLHRCSYARALEECRASAERELPELIADYCLSPAKAFYGQEPWFMSGLTDALLDSMKRWEQKQRAAIPQTTITRRVFEALDYSLRRSSVVLIQGNSRVGKAEAVKRWCEARPGVARLVAVPSSNADADWFRAIAKALGFSPAASTHPQKLREQIEYVLAHSRLSLVFDNAAWCIPQRYSRTTPATRLNWIQEAIIARHLPCAIVVTPESYNRALEKYLARTGYSIEEMLGGVGIIEDLPQDMEVEDARSIVRHLFPEFSAEAVRVIGAAAVRAKEHFSGVRRLGDRARDLIETAGFSESEAIAQALQDCGMRPPAGSQSTQKAKRIETADERFASSDTRDRAGIGIPRRDPLETEKAHA